MDSQAGVKNKHLLKMRAEVLSGFISALDEVRVAAKCLADDNDERISKRGAGLIRKIDSFAPSITLIGQVKAGKTALVNAMVGIPGLLPSDVNPWTSVVTELQINRKSVDGDRKARFTFFNRSEWDNLVSTGGRLGEMAGRAGATEESEKVLQQIVEMRDKTEARLGSSFELLLGKSHKYGYYDNELIQRYVCVGDPDEEEADPSNKRGRFADITKSAELALEIPQFPISMRFRDTPGVNDTFMVREQATLKSLRGSEICLVVLSAHQALNTTDMALIRMMSNFEKRQVILFVNRIDELENPSEQIAEIRDNIRETLKTFSVSEDSEIVFGSAKWAEAALSGDLDALSEDSQNALLNYASARPEVDAADSNDHTWILSGIPALMEAVYKRVLEGSGKRLVDSMGSQLSNIYNEIKAEKSAVHQLHDSGEVVLLETEEVKQALEELSKDSAAKLQKTVDTLRNNLHARLDRAQSSFVRRATDALIAHLDRFGEQDTWQYDATGLRLLFRSAYVQFAATLKKQAATLYAETATSIEDIYYRAVGVEIDGFKIEAPAVPTAPPPVVLARTIALDLNSNWWRRWWQKRKGFEAFAKDYSSLIQAEVASLVQELEGSQITEVLDEVQRRLHDFVQEQRDTLVIISENRGKEPLLLVNKTSDKSVQIALEDALAAIEKFAA